MCARVGWIAHLVAAVVLLGVASRADAAAAAPAPEGSAAPRAALPLIGGPSTCPQPDAVAAELATLVPRDRLTERLRAAAPAPVEIIDLGVPYQVVAAGRVREYRDEIRDCAYRARVAAVFVALAIDPASVLRAEPPPPAPAAALVTAAPAEAPPPRPGARLEVGLAVVTSAGAAESVAQAGAELRLAVGRRRLAPTGAVVVLVPVDTSVGGLRLRQWRVPADLGVRVHATGARAEAYGEAGVLAAWVSERALDLASARSDTSFELGLRAAVGVRLAVAARVAPFASLHAELVPSPADVFALPRGMVGHTPSFWIGATAGASMGLF